MLDQFKEWLSGLLPIQIIDIHIDEALGLSASISLPLLVGIILFLLATKYFFFRHTTLEVVEVEISLGNIGKASLKPNYIDIQIAHQIWTELVTRKAAIEIDPEHDVIIEVYNSWYALFQRIRILISEIPAEKIRRNESTRTLIRIATQSLNEGLRPHLTKWQARFRKWYEQQCANPTEESPQVIQKKFPEYDELIADLLSVNLKLIQYAEQLKKISEG